MKAFEYDENDPRPYQEQYDAWELCRDTIELDIRTYPGRGNEQEIKPNRTVITKRERSQ